MKVKATYDEERDTLTFRKGDSMKPQPKVAAAGIAGAVCVIIVWGVSFAGVNVPPEVASALTAVLAFGAGYLKS